MFAFGTRHLISSFFFFLSLPLGFPLPKKLIADTSTPRRSPSNVWNAERDSASRGRWPSTRSCIWRNPPTSVPCAAGASTSDRILRRICWPTPTSNRTTARLAARYSDGTVTYEGTVWRTIWERPVWAVRMGSWIWQEVPRRWVVVPVTPRPTRSIWWRWPGWIEVSRQISVLFNCNRI